MTCRSSKYRLPPSMPSAQPFPTTDPLRKNLNSSIAKIRRSTAPFLPRPVYSYVMTTVENPGGTLFQTGTAPNFQGDRITLCTCKHKDRCSPPPIGKRGPCPLEPWWGVWVAGLCSRTKCQPRALFYLMLVNGSYESPAAIWNALSAPAVKSAHKNDFGDIYEPLTQPCPSPWLESSYKPHRPTHRHDAKARCDDIETEHWGRHPRLLSGDPDHSYLWSKPMVSLTIKADDDWKSAHHRFFDSLDAFLLILQ
jgi:hypothetical protein